ncbi:carboxyl-terminal processing protease CtpC [Aphanothece sacrum]|uniref:Carboxyl-terminal-processing protease n=1 Tax=Aphanothece sacrum FPU1 TaxID=1920663 RepID=A0A401IC85_APHSA|nr:carboxyl-terminal processing protease CtpC [Aphanothece sacrum]GBF78898.1 carboxyl-terminal protease [Aphanothece sacrum FPU1]GBF83129.1 carboxyl-terminal protease [Aphanothece sacrum FPU3]
MVNHKKGLVLGATAFVLTAVAVTGAGLRLSRSQAFFQDNPKELVDEVWTIIDKTYVDGTFNQVDWRSVRQDYLNRSYTNKEEAYKAIREMLKKLGDPYTRFMNPEEFKNMQIDTSGELTGVGIQLSKDEKTKELVVIAPIEDTPAFAAGILSKDVITKINGKTTEGMEVEDAVKLIRGTPGSKVTLTIRRSDKEVDYSLVRARIELHPVRAHVEKTPIGDIGYIRLTQFSAQAGEEMGVAIKDLEGKKVQGYILDLRSNPGGLLYASVDIARMWLNDGKIVSTVSRTGEVELQRASNRALTNKPLVVLIDGGSASASEILSGALQDNKRAVLVGTTSFGKGLVQSVRGLGDGSGLAVTIAKYLTPSGRDINKHGIDPDVKLELTDEQRKALQQERDKIGTFGDPQFDKAFEILKGRIGTAKNPQSPTGGK